MLLDDRKWHNWFRSAPLPQKAAAVSVALWREVNDAVRQDQFGSQSQIEKEGEMLFKKGKTDRIFTNYMSD